MLRLCKERQNILGTEQNSEESSKIVFSEDVLRRENNSVFFESITLMTLEKEFFLSSLGKIVNRYLEVELLFF
jgi:hypothetical protein